MNNNKKTTNQKFMETLIKLEITEFIGVAKLLKVEMLKEDKETPRNFVDVFSDIVDAYDKLGRSRRRELLKIIKVAAAAPKKGDK